MSALPFSIPNLPKSDIDTILEIFDSLKLNFQVEYDFEYFSGFRKFEAFSNRRINSGFSISINNNFGIFFLAFIEIGYTYSYANKFTQPLIYEYQTWGMVTLKTNSGHILIKPETFLEKIYELINPIEINFDEDKEFSKKFYTVTDDKLKAESFLTKPIRTCIQNIRIKDFIIETINNNLIIGDRKKISCESAIEFAKFMDDVSKLH